MADPKFLNETHSVIKGDILLDFLVNRPSADAEEASDLDIKADIMAGNIKHLQWRQTHILRQIFSETQEMPYLILAAKNIAGIDWDDGIRAQGWILFSRATPDTMDRTIPAGTVLVSEADSDGNVIRASLLYPATLKTGQTTIVGLAQIVEIQAEDLVSYEIASSGGGVHLVAGQEIGSGSAGNVPDGTFKAFEATPPTGIETVNNLTPGQSTGREMSSASLFTIATGANQIKVNIDGAGASSVTLTAGSNLSGALVAADIQTQLRAVATGGYTLALCLYNLTGSDYKFVILSGTTGAASSVVVTAGVNDASVLLGLDEVIETLGGAGFSGGINPQTKASLKSEYEIAIREGGEAGTASDYGTWAKDSGQGVDGAKVTGLTGAVLVFPVTNSGVLLTQTQLDAVKAYIETKAPVHLIGSITVANPTISTIYVSATLALSVGFTLGNVSVAVKAAIKNYILSVPIGDAPGTAIVRYSKISAVILGVSGVEDATNLLVDSVTPTTGTVNIVLANGTVAQTADGDITLT